MSCISGNSGGEPVDVCSEDIFRVFVEQTFRFLVALVDMSFMDPSCPLLCTESTDGSLDTKGDCDWVLGASDREFEQVDWAYDRLEPIVVVKLWRVVGRWCCFHPDRGDLACP